MAIARGAGTEIIRTIHLEDVADTARILIEGEQHHIYTILSVVCFMRVNQSDPDFIQMFLECYDSNAGTTDQTLDIFKQNMNQLETFVWNDKFSFNGYEPIDFAGPMDDTTKQNAIADQGSAVAQRMKIVCETSSNRLDGHCTYIDQNNS